MSEQWLPLMEYSSKYRVSVSTLRRRIKAEDIKYRFEDGKYMILDTPTAGSHQRAHRPSQESESTLVSSPANSTASASPERNNQQDFESSTLSAANRLLTELKKAYTLILHEKEEQILALKEEVSDLKTLVRVLESENDKLKR